MTELRIYITALEKQDPAERAAFLEDACQANPVLRRRVEALLVAHEASALVSAGFDTVDPGPDDQGAPLPSLPGTRIGPYLLIQKIGEGGMGSVYLAQQDHPVRREVALKLIKLGMDSRQVVARFDSERQALALMDHPNIARVLDAGTSESGRPYFVMELVRGVPITEYCDQNQMPAAERLRLFVDVCHAIQHAHHKGIIHRDLKPSNVMVTAVDGVPIVKVIDFGVAKATDQKLTERTVFTAIGQMIGTPAYMSPEQADVSGIDIDTRSDVYSLGVLLYELLTGTTPLEFRMLREAGFAEIQRLIRAQEPPRPSARLSSLGDSATTLAGNRGTEPRRLAQMLAGDLDWIVMKALAKDRDLRYDTPGNFAADIDRYLRGDAILARPPSSIYRLKRFAQRNRVAVLTTAAVAMSLVIGTAVAAWQAVLATQAQHDALISARAERDAKEIAQKREAETRAVLEFVENRVFAAAGPKSQDGGMGYDVKLADAIKSGLKFVETSFPNQPLIEARLRMSMGQSFLRLGDAPTAADQYQRARDLYTQELGPDHLDVIAAVTGLSNAMAMLGRDEVALTLDREALALRVARLGRDHPDTLMSMNNVATSLYQLRRPAEALPIFEEVLALRQVVLGPHHLDTFRSMTGVAACNAALGRPEIGAKLHEQALALMRIHLGPDHSYTLKSMHNLANVYYSMGRFPEALALFQESFAARKAKLGPDHPDTLVSMNNLANTYSALGRHAQALELNERTLALMTAKLGPEHPNTLMNMSNLAWQLATSPDPKSRDPARALVLAQKAVQSAPKIPNYRSSLGIARYRTGDWKGAISDLAQAIGLRPPDDPTNANDAYFLAMAHFQAGDKPAARDWLAKADAWMRKGGQDDADLKRFQAEAAQLLDTKPAP